MLTLAVDVKITCDSLNVDLNDGRTISVPLEWYPRLVLANVATFIGIPIAVIAYLRERRKDREQSELDTFASLSNAYREFLVLCLNNPRMSIYSIETRCDIQRINMKRRGDTMNYNLLEEKWIPVLWKDGNTSRVGIVEALAQAGRIRQIAASNPMDRLAVLRFLLALLYWCKGNPPEGEDSIRGDSFPSDWFTKLYDNKDSFDLLGDGKRFYQYKSSGGHGQNKKLSANYLVHEVPTGKNPWHFRHSTDKKHGLCPACCSVGLLRLPVFATSGGTGKSPGINSKPPVYVVPLGSSLADTLLLSWRKISDIGTPAWENPDLKLPASGDVPLLTGLTCLPRRVWLDDPDGYESRCISCGRSEHLIRQSVFAGIGSMKTEKDGDGRYWEDPHVIRNSKDKDIVRPASALDRADAAAGQWLAIADGILRGQKADGGGRLWIVGFATVKNDKYIEAMEYETPFARALEDKELQELLGKIEAWQKECKGLEKKLGRSRIEGATAIAAIRPHVEGVVSAKAGELLAGGDDAWGGAAAEYSPMMTAVAKSLSPGFTTMAVERRRQLSRVKPDMQQKPKAAKKHGQEKGEDK